MSVMAGHRFDGFAAHARSATAVAVVRSEADSAVTTVMGDAAVAMIITAIMISTHFISFFLVLFGILSFNTILITFCLVVGYFFEFSFILIFQRQLINSHVLGV